MTHHHKVPAVFDDMGRLHFAYRKQFVIVAMNMKGLGGTPLVFPIEDIMHRPLEITRINIVCELIGNLYRFTTTRSQEIILDRDCETYSCEGGNTDLFCEIKS